MTYADWLIALLSNDYDQWWRTLHSVAWMTGPADIGGPFDTLGQS